LGPTFGREIECSFHFGAPRGPARGRSSSGLFSFRRRLIRFHQPFKLAFQLGELLRTFSQPSFESADLFFKSFSFHKGANCLAYMIDERKESNPSLMTETRSCTSLFDS
jgi:hypothetical protein